MDGWKDRPTLLSFPHIGDKIQEKNDLLSYHKEAPRELNSYPFYNWFKSLKWRCE